MTRMWMVPPVILCRQHLLGCHKEIHFLLGHLAKQKSITGWIKHDCIELPVYHKIVAFNVISLRPPRVPEEEQDRHEERACEHSDGKKLSIERRLKRMDELIGNSSNN